jgi:RNA polymerase sigma factor (sigma-70 family)
MKRPILRLPLAALPDADLAGMAARGDEAAYEAIVRRYEPALKRYCRRLTRDGARADDAVQQALVSAWSALRQGAEVRELKPWLHRIAHNAVVRTVTREREFPAPADVHAQAQSVSAVIELSMETRAALTALAALPEHQRAAMVGTAIDGRSRGEMARELGLSEGAVRQLLHRARATLREATAGLTPFSPAVRFLRRRSEGLPAPDAAPALAGGSAGAIVATICKLGAVLAATGALVAGPVAHTLLSRMQSVSQPVESVAGLPSGTGNAVAPARIELPPHGYEPGSGGRGSTPANAVAIAAPDVTATSDPNATDSNGGDATDSGTGEAQGDNADAALESPDPSSNDGADQSSDPAADAAADTAQAPDIADPATDPSPPVDPAPDPAPADPVPPDPLVTP